MPKGKKKAPVSQEAENLPERLVELQREVKRLRELLGQEVDRSISSLPETLDVLVGMVRGQWISIPIACVLEVLPRVLLTPLPEVPPYVPGYLQWRGCQVPVIDLAARWGETPLPIKLEDRIVVIEYRNRKWAFLLTSVDQLQRISRSQLDLIPSEIPSAPFAIGLWSNQEGSVVLLSIAELILPLETVEV